MKPNSLHEQFRKKWNNIWIYESQHPLFVGPSDFAKMLVENGKIKKGDKVLGLGSGLALDEIYFAENGAVVVVSDISDSAIADIKARLSKRQNETLSISLQIQDLLEDFTFPKDTFDIVYAHQSLMYFNRSEMEEIAAKISNVLNESGKLYISVRSINDYKYKDNVNAANKMATGRDGITRYFFDKDDLVSIFNKFFTQISIEEHIISRYKDQPDSHVLYMFATKV